MAAIATLGRDARRAAIRRTTRSDHAAGRRRAGPPRSLYVKTVVKVSFSSRAMYTMPLASWSSVQFTVGKSGKVR